MKNARFRAVADEVVNSCLTMPYCLICFRSTIVNIWDFAIFDSREILIYQTPGHQEICIEIGNDPCAESDIADTDQDEISLYV